MSLEPLVKEALLTRRTMKPRTPLWLQYMISGWLGFLAHGLITYLLYG